MATSAARIRLIYTTARDDAGLLPFVTIANLIVTENLSDCGLSESRKDLIADYLAAHFLNVSDRAGVVRKKLGEADETYDDGKTAMNALASTPYGAQAIILDTCNILAALLANNGLKAQFSVV